MKRIASLTAIASLCAAAAFAHAQSTGYVGPSTKAAPSAGYTGPSNVPLMTAKDLLANGKDDQYVRLKGKLTSHKGDENYEFTDASGKIMVEIDADRFPAGVTVDHNTLVELTGEFDKEMFGDSTVDVEQIKVVAQ